MKKIVLLSAFISVMLVSISANSAAAGRKYILGYQLTQSSSQSANLKVIMDEIIKVIKTRHGIDSTIIFYKNAPELLKAAKSGKVDFILTTELALYHNIIKTLSYKPLATYAVSGNVQSRDCILVGKDNPAKKVSDLKGKSALTYDKKGDYYLLRSLTGADPASFFGSLKPSPNGLSMVYALALGDVDAVFIIESNLKYLKATNPGPLKKVRVLGCTMKFAAPPLMVAKNVPADVAANVTNTLVGIRNDKDFKKFAPLFKSLDLSYEKVTLDDYKQLFSLLELYENKKYYKEFDNWMLRTGN